MLTRLYGCVTVRAGFLHPWGYPWRGYAPSLPHSLPPEQPAEKRPNASEKHLYRSVTIWRGAGHPVAWGRKNIEWNHDY